MQALVLDNAKHITDDANEPASTMHSLAVCAVSRTQYARSRALTVGLVAVVGPVPKRRWRTRCPLRMAIRVGSAHRGRACRGHSRHLPARPLPGSFAPTLAVFVPKQSLVWSENRSPREPGLFATRAILAPCFGQVQPPPNRQTRTPRRYRQTHGRLAIVVFANLATILPRDAHRVLALFGKTCVIHNPGRHRTMFLHRRQHLPPNLGQHLLIVPGRVSDQVMQALMHPPDIMGGQTGGHRFDTLAFPRQQQTHAVTLQWHVPVGMPRGVCQALHICREAPLLWAWRREA